MTRAHAFSLLLAAALTVGGAACKEDKPAPAAKPAAGAPDLRGSAATPKDTMAPTGAPADKKPADLGGLQANAVPAQSLQALDGVAQFSLGDDKVGCAQYGRDVAAFFTEFQSEFNELEAKFSPDGNGVAAMRKFAAFLKRGATSMKTLKVEGDELSRAHLEFVATVEDLAGGFDDLAVGLEGQDEAKTTAAAGRVQNAVNNFKSSLDRLVAFCGE